MTKEEIINYEPEKVESISDFIAFCSYHDSDFCYDWEDKKLRLWIPFDKLNILTHQVLSSDYFNDGHYPPVNMYDGGVRIDDQEEIKCILDWCELDTEEKVLAVFPKHETYNSTYLLEEEIDKYFKRLEELGIR